MTTVFRNPEPVKHLVCLIQEKTITAELQYGCEGEVEAVVGGYELSVSLMFLLFNVLYRQSHL